MKAAMEERDVIDSGKVREGERMGRNSLVGLKERTKNNRFETSTKQEAAENRIEIKSYNHLASCAQM
jgi:predicted lysophospholipase L1 biosynthesis ABC-type transport system permease subunit